MLANGFEQCQSEPSVLQSASFQSGGPGLKTAVNPCSFGLSPEFSTPVEKPVENPPNERLGPDTRAHRNESESSFVLHMVPADLFRCRRPHVDRGPGAERSVHELADDTLFGRDGRSNG